MPALQDALAREGVGGIVDTTAFEMATTETDGATCSSRDDEDGGLIADGQIRNPKRIEDPPRPGCAPSEFAPGRRVVFIQVGDLCPPRTGGIRTGACETGGLGYAKGARTTESSLGTSVRCSPKGDPRGSKTIDR